MKRDLTKIKNMPFVDWHTHLSLKSALFHRDLSKFHTRRIFSRGFSPLTSRADFPKIIQGGLDVSLSVAYIPEVEWQEDIPPIRWLKWLAPRAWKRIFGAKSYYDATITALKDVEVQAAKHNLENKDEEWFRRIAICRCFNDVKQAMKDNSVSVIHAVEGGHSLHGEFCGKEQDDWENAPYKEARSEVLANLLDFAQRGVAYLTLSHFYPNILSNPVFPYPEYASKFAKWKSMLGRWDTTQGLTNIGVEVVEASFNHPIIVDVAHCTPLARSQVYDLAEKHRAYCKVIASHTGCYEIKNDMYNLEDWEIKWIADNGGVISTILMNYWLVPHHTALGLDHVAKTIGHVVKVGGIDAAAIGTDFDGFTDPPDDLEDMSEIQRIPARLASEMAGINKPRYSNKDLQKILGGNSLRVLEEGWG